MVGNGHNVVICIWYEMVIMYRSAYGTKWQWYEMVMVRKWFSLWYEMAGTKWLWYEMTVILSYIENYSCFQKISEYFTIKYITDGIRGKYNLVCPARLSADIILLYFMTFRLSSTFLVIALEYKMCHFHVNHHLHILYIWFITG